MTQHLGQMVFLGKIACFVINSASNYAYFRARLRKFQFLFSKFHIQLTEYMMK